MEVPTSNELAHSCAGIDVPDDVRVEVAMAEDQRIEFRSVALAGGMLTVFIRVIVGCDVVMVTETYAIAVLDAVIALGVVM